MFVSIILLLIGFALLIFAADWLVEGAASIASGAGVSPLVIGLTMVAFGTSAPELAVSVVSAFEGETDLAIGNVVGSNIFNILVVVGIAALFAPLIVHRQLIKFDLPFMIGLSVLLLLISRDGMIDRWNGVILFLLAITYVGGLLWKAKLGKTPVCAEELEEIAPHDGKPKLWKNLGLVVLGMGGLVLGSQFLVDSSVKIATALGVSELIIGLTIISLGTSLPEVATSIIAVRKGERDIAVGNVVGSNIFNIVTVVGISAIVAPSGIPVPSEAINFDLPVMLFVAIAAFPIFFYGYQIGRTGGVFFLLLYGIYLAYLFLEASNAPLTGDFLKWMKYAAFYLLSPLLILLFFLSFSKNKSISPN